MSSSLTVWRPPSSNQTTRSTWNRNSKGKQGSFRMVVTWTRISAHSSLYLPKTLLAIPIIPTILVIQHRASPSTLIEAAVPTYHQHLGFQRKSTKAERPTGTAVAAAAEATHPTFEPNTASQTHLTTTPAITAAMTADKSSTQSPSTRSSKPTSLQQLISNKMGEAWRYGLRIGELGKQSVICNVG